MRSPMDDPMVLESSLPYPKTLDESVLLARAAKIQEVRLLENGVDENVTEADSSYIEVTGRGGLEVAPFEPSHCSEYDGSSEPSEGAETEPAQEQEPSSLAKPHGKDSLEDEVQYNGCEGSLSKFPGGGTVGRGAKGRVEGEKKRKRCSKKSPAGRTNGREKRGERGGAGAEKLRKNWTDEETESLLQAVPAETKFQSRVDKFSGNEPSWEAISEAVSGRTGDECRRRMDTLKKAYKAINRYFEQGGIKVSQVTDEDFEVMMLTVPKLSTRLKRSWYNYVHNYIPPRSYKKMTNQGAGSPLKNGVNSDSCAPMSGTLGELDLRVLEYHSSGHPALTPAGLSGPHCSINWEQVGTSDSGAPTLDLPRLASPARVQSYRCDATQELPYIVGLPQHPTHQGVRDTQHGPNSLVTDFEDTVPHCEGLSNFQHPLSTRNLQDMDCIYDVLEFESLAGF